MNVRSACSSLACLALWFCVAPAAYAGQQAAPVADANLFAPPKPAPTIGGCPRLPVQAFYACAKEKTKTFRTPPRAANGKPDLTADWGYPWGVNNSLEDLPKELVIEIVGPGRDDIAGPLGVGRSVVVDTPDLKIPYQPWARTHAEENWKDYVDPESMCMAVIPSRMSTGTDPAKIMIRQTAANVFVASEWGGFRRVPVGGPPHVSGKIRLFHGDSRGRWDGDTFVVETTNFNGLGWLDVLGNFYSDSMKQTERYTYVDADTVLYEATIEDPRIYTRPWTIAWPLTRVKAKGLAGEPLEYQCHEGNLNWRAQLAHKKLYRGVRFPAR